MSTRRPSPGQRSDFAHFRDIPTRWADNDQYGHVNNVAYYAFFDTVVNDWLINRGLLDTDQGSMIGLVVETACQYFAPASFPERLDAGLKVTRIGNSSVHYEIGIFRRGEDTVLAQGRFVHVYVDAHSRRPVMLPDHWRSQLETLLV